MSNFVHYKYPEFIAVLVRMKAIVNARSEYQRYKIHNQLTQHTCEYYGLQQFRKVIA